MRLLFGGYYVDFGGDAGVGGQTDLRHVARVCDSSSFLDSDGRSAHTLRPTLLL